MANVLKVKKIVEICDGKLFCGEDNIVCTSFTKDTREIHEKDVYIGIKGETFDGNLFYKEAFLKGAIACIIEKSSFVVEEDYIYDKPIILVENSIEALKKLAMYKRNISSAFFVGVTGSVGKTSTRDMIYSVLKEEFMTLKTEGNYNNNIGLPLTLLRLQEEKAAVIEMGMNALGEIDYLTKIARPNISVITNIGTAHIGELGSRENILKAKLEILNGMDEEGILILNNDNDLLHEYYENHKKNIITIGIDQKSDVQAANIQYLKDSIEFNILYKKESTKVVCPIASTAFIYNSLVAYAVGKILGIETNKIKNGIASFSLTKNRLENFKIKENITIINDVYNASVDSMKSSLEILKNQSGKRKIAVLGSMLELGTFSKELHEEVGKSVVENQVNILVTIGKDAKYIATSSQNRGMEEENIYSFETNEEAIDFLKDFLKSEDVVLLKASNGMHFIEIVESLKNI